MQKRCKCGSTVGVCPECGHQYDHGTESQCQEPSCLEVNAPIDCLCGFVVEKHKRGVLDFNMKLIPWR